MQLGYGEGVSFKLLSEPVKQEQEELILPLAESSDTKPKSPTLIPSSSFNNFVLNLS